MGLVVTNMEIKFLGCDQMGALGQPGGGLGAPAMWAICTHKCPEAASRPDQDARLHGGQPQDTPKAG